MDFVQQSAIPSFAMLVNNKEQLHPTAKHRNNGRVSPQRDEDGEISIRAGGETFTLKKMPLVEKCGYIRKRTAERGDEMSICEISDVPGGVRGFQLAVRFCFGDPSLEIDSENVAEARCVAEYLEMTEECAEGNLVARAEEYLGEVVLRSLQDSITVLRHSEGLLPASEKAGLVGRCVDAIARIACSDARFGLPRPRREGGRSPLRVPPHQEEEERAKGFTEWWAEDLTVLRVETFRRVVAAMKARGFKPQALGTVLMLYAQKSLRGLDIFGRGGKKMEPRKEHEKRIVLETVVSMLPKEKNVLSVSFLTMLLRAAAYLETTVACRLDLEKRIGLQLVHAVPDDLLIPCPFSFTDDTVFDVDSVRRILVHYLEDHEEAAGGAMSMGNATDDDYALLPPSGMERVGRLMECYLAEIATDRNLTVAKFVSLAELVPEQARVVEDGMYRAIDIYLKAHPSLADAERKKICSVMDCQKLSREACAHAVQNQRLPMQIVVQVMYYEQQRLCDAADAPPAPPVGAIMSPLRPQALLLSPLHNAPPDSELARLRKENDSLKVELVRVKSQMKQTEKTGSGSPLALEKPPPPKKSIMESVTRKLGRLNPFDSTRSPSVKARALPRKDRRHSIS